MDPNGVHRAVEKLKEALQSIADAERRSDATAKDVAEREYMELQTQLEKDTGHSLEYILRYEQNTGEYPRPRGTRAGLKPPEAKAFRCIAKRLGRVCETLSNAKPPMPRLAAHLDSFIKRNAESSSYAYRPDSEPEIRWQL
jgi:hypothetical protein